VVDETRAIGTTKPSRIVSITIFIVASPLMGTQAVFRASNAA
jgi:hypothetical protein